MPFRGAHNASKYAVEGWSDTLRFERYIDVEQSVHHEKYLAILNRLNKPGPAVPFTLPPEAVLKKVTHALEADTPKARYYVTFPTHLFGFLKRILPVSVLPKAGNDHQCRYS